MDRLIVRNSSIEITGYNFGDCPKLEKFFAIYEPITHSYRYVGLKYDSETNTLYIPRGLDIWYIEQLTGLSAEIEVNKFNKYDTYNDIKIKYLPRDDDQVKALRFATGRGEYKDTQGKSQLSINLNTGKGKTYVSIGTMSVYGIKSVIITYSKSVLQQWKKCILEYTNIEAKEIFDLDGSGSIYRYLQKSEEDRKAIKVFLVTHGTLKSYGDTHGWDKVDELFEFMRVGLKFYDEAHTNFDNMCMIDYHSSVYKTFYLTATPARSNDEENRIYQTAFKNVLAIDLFHEDSDPHTHYVAMRYNSRPSPKTIAFCKNKYGLDRNKYTNYIISNHNFQMAAATVLDFIFSKICKSYDDKLLIYIGTNEAISNFYQWIVEYFPMFKNDIGIFTSMVSSEDKQFALTRRIILSTTKSAGAAMDIKGLKCTLVLAEPFKSEVLARQTLGRTRANNTYYIELVDKGFRHCNKYFLEKRFIFKKYALDCAVVELNDQELFNTYNRVVKVSESIKNPKVRPFITKDTVLIRPFTIGHKS